MLQISSKEMLSPGFSVSARRWDSSSMQFPEKYKCRG